MSAVVGIEAVHRLLDRKSVEIDSIGIVAPPEQRHARRIAHAEKYRDIDQRRTGEQAQRRLRKPGRRPRQRDDETDRQGQDEQAGFIGNPVTVGIGRDAEEETRRSGASRDQGKSPG